MASITCSVGIGTEEPKKQSQNTFTMRFPTKAKMVELAKFKKLDLLGTRAVVQVLSGTFESQAIGKLHIVLVKCGKVSDFLRHVFGMCEFGTSLCPVLEFNMDSIDNEFVRVKMGVTDQKKIPAYNEITSKELWLFVLLFR